MKPEAVLSLVLDLCERLTREAVAATDLGRQLGDLEAEGATSVRVKPFDTMLKTVLISRDRTSLQATYVDATLAVPAEVDIQVFKQRFGEPTVPPRVEPRQPARYLFRPAPTPGGAFACAILLSIEGPATAVPLRVTSVAVRRDPLP